MKTALLLEGGGMRGLYTSGVLDTLMDTGLTFDALVGVSAGALFGVNYKSRQKGRGLRYNLKYARDPRYMSVWSLLTSGNILNRKFAFDRLVNELDPFDFDAFRSSPEEFYAVVTRLSDGKAEYIKLDDLRVSDQMEYLRASGSLPFVSRPVKIGGELYLDGGIADSIPYEWVRSQGYDRIVAVLTRPADYRKPSCGERAAKLYYRKYPEFAKAAISRPERYNAEVELIRSAEGRDGLFVLRPTRHIDIGRLEKDPAVMQRMYDLGVSDCQGAMDSLMKFMQTSSLC